MTDDNSNPDTAEAKINLLFDSYADGDISADEAKKQLKGLLVDARLDARIAEVKYLMSLMNNYESNGYTDPMDVLECDVYRLGQTKLKLQQTRQEEERE